MACGVSSSPAAGVVRLVRAHGDLRVPGAFHGPLVYVGRPDDDVLVVHDHPFGVHVDHEPPLFLRRVLEVQVKVFSNRENILYYISICHA
jgi:hypothetical protein